METIYHTDYCYGVQVVCGYYVYLQVGERYERLTQVFEPWEVVSICDRVTSAIKAAEQDMSLNAAIDQVLENINEII